MQSDHVWKMVIVTIVRGQIQSYHTKLFFSRNCRKKQLQIYLLIQEETNKISIEIEVKSAKNQIL